MVSYCGTPYTFPCPKHPSDEVDYQLDGRNYLAGDTIQSVSFVLTGVTLQDHEITSSAKQVNFRLSGGTTDTLATIALITTLGSGQIKRFDAKLRIS